MKTAFKIALLSTCLAATAAHAAKPADNGPGQGTSSYKDVVLKGDFSDKFNLIQGSQINPLQSTGGFASAFTNSGTGATGWSLAETVEKGSSSLKLVDVLTKDNLSFSFTLDSGKKTGTWSVTNTSSSNNITVDMALSFHAGNNVGSFLIDDQTILAGQKQTGTWAINWLNNKKAADSIPDFSNLAIYTGSYRSVTAPVPEPTTYGMLLGGLALLGFVARRRKA